MDNRTDLLFRPSPEPCTSLPFGARSVGHYSVTGNYREKARRKGFVQVFWGIKGRGRMVLGGVERELGPGQVAAYFPGMVHDLYAASEVWEYRWWTMDGPLASSVATSFGLAADVFDAGPAPIKLFEQLEEAIRDISREGELRACAIAFELLTRAAGFRDKERTDPAVAMTLEKMHRDWSDPGLCVKTLAAHVRVNRSSLSRRFHREMGMPPLAYLNALRLQNALSLLAQSGKPVGEIAHACGFSDPNYFSRLMRKARGVSPLEFRKER